MRYLLHWQALAVAGDDDYEAEQLAGLTGSTPQVLGVVDLQQ